MKGYLRIEGVGNEPVSARWYYDSEDAMKGYLRIEGVGNEPVSARWYYDSEDPDESSIVLAPRIPGDRFLGN
jgi:hypothetical protein